MDSLINDQFIKDYPLFSIEGIIICISEYIGKDCELFLTFFNKNNRLNFLYTEYDFLNIEYEYIQKLESKIDYKKVRYLKNIINTINLKKYEK
jgi:hypothetical protein